MRGHRPLALSGTDIETDVRVECPHAKDCPGCALIELSPSEQHMAKLALVRSELAVHPGLVDLAPTELRVLSEPIAYRTRAKLVLGKGGALGLFRAGTHDVVDLPGCRVQRPAIEDAARAIRALTHAAATPVLVSTEDGGPLAGIDLREVLDPSGRARLLLTLLLREPVTPALLRLTVEALRVACPRVVSIAVDHGGGPQLLSGRLEILDGPSEAPDRLREEGPFHFAAHGSFVQANRAVAVAILDRIERLVRTRRGAPPRVLELFAGSATTGLSLARAGCEVISVEIFGPSIERAERAAAEQGLADRFRTHRGDADAMLREAIAAGERFDLVVVNPPRRGLSAQLRRDLARLAPGRVVYVSCEPSTLARDLSHLGRIGLGGVSVDAFDMMPLTDKVECVAILAPAPIPPATILLERGDLVVALKLPHEPTAPHPDHETSLTARVRAIPGLEEATPLHRLDEGTSGLCLFARRPGAAAGLSAGLPAATKTYLALVRGLPHKKGTIAAPLSERGRAMPAVTRYVRREIVAGHALLEASPEQARTHQVRRHLAHIDHAVLGDARHGHAPSNRHMFERYGLDRTFLHLRCLVLRVMGEDLVLEAPLAPDLERTLTAMRGAK